ETTERFRPRIAAFLNLTPDHMDRHKSMENYAAAKAKVFANQGAGDVLVYNADDERVAALAEKALSKKIPFSRQKTFATGAFAQGGQIVFADAGKTVFVIGADELRIPGAHNLENALAAVAIAFAAGIDPAVTAETLGLFKGVEHRLEIVATIGGVRFVNDSKGTNPDAAIKAVEAIGRDIILIAGGYDKNADFTDYIRAAKGRVRQLLLLGATAEKIKACAEAEGLTEITMAGGMGEAVRLGFELARPGDTVLLSPACASWDMYSCFEERGAHFKEKVCELREWK
ncbi:MAG: UDP-N-acetylmuramoyl-L-alanine--D-glutamate ligase, partial [Clostridiales Family XIII bacterium]|nr:UDP-N-acetylmuramoyl-L-alanine--D-glutamate ligase [Clostridiales Family XIII bacterium]